MLKKVLYPFVCFFNWLFSGLVWVLSVPFFSEKKCFFVSYYGKTTGDNPGELMRQLSLRNDFRLVCAFNGDKNDLPKNVTFVKYRKFFGFSMLFHLFTSKVIVNNSRFDFDIRKKRKQLYIQTWHGGGAQKKAEADAKETLPGRYIKNAKRDSSYIDIFLSDSRFMSKVYTNSYWYDGKVLETGYPRYDALFNASIKEEIKNKVCSSLGIDDDRKIVLYAPTFRNDYSRDPFDLDVEGVIGSCERAFGGRFVCVVRLHPNLKGKVSLLNDRENTIDATNYSDSQELLVAADVMISDYSSIAFDFCLMGKPVFRYVKDLDMYKKERNFYFDFEDYPFPFGVNNEDLIHTIECFDANNYRKELNLFMKTIGQVSINQSTPLVCGIIADYLNGLSKTDLLKKYDYLAYKG